MNERHSPRRWVVLTGLVASVTVLAGTVARWVIERELAPGVPIELIGDLARLSRGENTGVAFGLFQGSPLVPWVSSLALIVVAIGLARAVSHAKAGGIPIGLILGGGLANLLDRLADGRVTDYIDVGLGTWRYPTFNLPDSAIVVGLILTVWLLSRGDAHDHTQPPHRRSALPPMEAGRPREGAS
jgi:signal peptidase II